jgi:hypothetical protein
MTTPTIDQPTQPWGASPPSPPPPKPNRRTRILAAAGLGLLLTVGSIAYAAGASTSDPAPAPTTAPASPSTQPSPDEGLTLPEETPDPEPAELAIGDTWVWEDGLEATVTDMKRYPLGEWAAGGDPDRHDKLVVTIKLTAGDKASGDLMVTSTMLYGKNGRAAESVFDDLPDGSQIDGMQETPDQLRAGRSVTGTFGFAVPKGGPTDVVLTVNPGLDYEDATFTGRG